MSQSDNESLIGHKSFAFGIAPKGASFSRIPLE